MIFLCKQYLLNIFLKSYILYFQHLQVEQSDLINKVDSVRDSALDIMNRSEKYHKMVEPELTALNQHWEEVSNKLKVGLTYIYNTSKLKEQPSKCKTPELVTYRLSNAKMEQFLFPSLPCHSVKTVIDLNKRKKHTSNARPDLPLRHYKIYVRPLTMYHHSPLQFPLIEYLKMKH